MPQSIHTNRTLQITIAPGGAIAIEASGFKGADCEVATRELEQALGVVRQRIRRPAFYQKAGIHQPTLSQQSTGS
jgi:hypothetical protein